MFKLAGASSPEPARRLRSGSATLVATLLLLALLAPLASADGEDHDHEFPIMSIKPTTMTLPKRKGRFHLGNGEFALRAYKRRYRKMVKVQFRGPAEGKIKLVASGDCGKEDSPLEVRFVPESISVSSLTEGTKTARFKQFIQLADNGNVVNASSGAFYTCVIKVVRNSKIIRGMTETVSFLKPSSPSGPQQ